MPVRVPSPQAGPGDPVHRGAPAHRRHGQVRRGTERFHLSKAGGGVRGHVQAEAGVEGRLGCGRDERREEEEVQRYR